MIIDHAMTTVRSRPTPARASNEHAKQRPTNTSSGSADAHAGWSRLQRKVNDRGDGRSTFIGVVPPQGSKIDRLDLGVGDLGVGGEINAGTKPGGTGKSGGKPGRSHGAEEAAPKQPGAHSKHGFGGSNGAAAGKKSAQSTAAPIERQYHDLVRSLDAIRSAREAGDTDAMQQQFAAAKQGFNQLVQQANALDLNVTTGDAEGDADKRAMGEVLSNAYSIANVIEQETPGEETL